MAEYKQAERKRAPTHPGVILKRDVFPALGLSNAHAAQILRVSRQHLMRVLSAQASMSLELCLKVGKLTGNGAEFWLNIQNTHDLWHARQSRGIRTMLAAIPGPKQRQGMDRIKAIMMFNRARQYCEKNYPNKLDEVNAIGYEKFQNMKSREFLYNYCYVVYASGFEASKVKSKFPDLQAAFKNFEIRSLAKMRSIRKPLAIFNNERKACSFLKGSKNIAGEGFSNFKKRLKCAKERGEQGLNILEELPGIGRVTKYHLAKDIGLADVAKPDIWLERAAKHCNSTVDDLIDFLSEKYSLPRRAVDIILWRYGSDKKLGLHSTKGGS